MTNGEINVTQMWKDMRGEREGRKRVNPHILQF